MVFDILTLIEGHWGGCENVLLKSVLGKYVDFLA